jgi:large exoprotein involved in heme utilization and adhesion
VNVNARDTVSFVGESPNNRSSRVYSRVEEKGVGQAGDIYIKTGSLSVSDGAYLSASTSGIGDAGDVTIDARDTVRFDGAGPAADDFFPSGAYARVNTNARGQGGNVNITTGSLFVTNGARLITSTEGQGNAGNVNVNARDIVSFVGESPGNSSSGAFTWVGDEGVGQAGDIYIKTGSLLVSDGAFLSANTGGHGNAGNITIHARDTVSFVGAGPPADKFFPSVAQTQVNPGARGQGGDIYISTGSLEVTGGAFLSARTLGQGNAGNVTINARDKVSFNGVGRSPLYPFLGSGAYSQVHETGVGQAGDIYISTGSLEVTGGAYLSAGTLGKGDAGDVTINARDKVSFDGVGTNGISSGAYGQARLSNTQGQGGNVNITAGSLSVTNGAVLSSSTYSQKNAGNVNINVRDLVSFDGVGTNGISSGARSQVEENAGGNGGSVNITTGSLSVTNGAELIVSSFGQGRAGDLIINARNTVRLDNQSRIGATTIVGNGGNITIDSGSFSLRDGASVTASTFGQGNAGTIKVNAADFFIISGSSSNLNTGLFVNSQSPTATAGDIIVTSPRVTLDTSGRLDAESASGNGGDINLQTDLLLLRRESQITTTAGTALAGGNGGNINIDADFIVAVPQENSDITANAFSGNGGAVTINAQGIFGIQPRQQPTPQSDITASSTGGGINGVVDINTLEIDPSRGFITYQQM